MDYIKLDKVLWDRRAMNNFCQLPYPNHKYGCPNFPKCVLDEQYRILRELNGLNKEGIVIIDIKKFQWYAVVVEFNLEEHAKKMKSKHPKWTKQQCKCIYYWQNKVRKELKEKTKKVYKEIKGDCYTLKPEALGINVFGTMATVGMVLYKNPKIVRKIAFIGKKV